MRIPSLYRSPYLFMAGPALRGPARITEVMSPKNTAPAEHASIDEWGGKAFNLAQALLDGQNVPEFFVVTTSAVDEGINFSEIRQRCNEIRRQFPGCKFSVRSSATIEDADKSSFAGMYESVLDCETNRAIEKAIEKVVDSLHSQRVLDHKRKMGIETQEKMAVIIQRMVPNPKFSGVIYLPLPTNPAVIGIDYVCDQYADKLVAGEKPPNFLDLVNSPPFQEIIGGSETQNPYDFIRIDGLARAIQIAKTAPGNRDIEFCVDGNNKLYFLQQRRLIDVEPPADFTIAEVKKTIDPADILFEGELTRGKTPREGIICDVFSGYSYQSKLWPFYRFNAFHQDWALVMDHFPDSMVDVHRVTDGKKAVIVVDAPQRTSHILTIIRTEAPGLVFIGISNRLDLLLTLSGSCRIRIFSDGYQSIVCKAPPKEMKHPLFEVIRSFGDRGEENIILAVEIRLKGNRFLILNELEKILNSKGVECEGHPDEISNPYYYFGDRNWKIELLRGYNDLPLPVRFEGNLSDVSKKVLAAFKEYFGI